MQPEGPRLLPGPKPKMSTDEAKAAVKEVLQKNVFLTTELRHDRKTEKTQQILRVKNSRRRIFLESPQFNRHMQERTWYRHLKEF